MKKSTEKYRKNLDRIRELGKILEPYVMYGDYNMWELSEPNIYNNFFRTKRLEPLSVRVKDRLSRRFVKSIENRRERDAKGGKINTEILAVAYDITHTKTLHNILIAKKRQFIRNDGPMTNITGEMLRKLEENYIDLDSFASPKIRKEIKKIEKEFLKRWKNFKRDKALEKELGKDYVKVYSVLRFGLKTRKRFLEIIRMILLSERVFELGKFKKIVVADDINPLGAIVCSIARKMKIPSLNIQHGQLIGNPVGRINADKMAVNGYMDKKYLIAMGAPKNKIVVTGQARYDTLYKLNLSKRKACKKLKWDSNKIRIMFSAQNPSAGETISKTALECFIKEIAKIKNKEKYEFVVTSREDFIEKNFPKIPKGLKIKRYKGHDIHNVILASDVYTTAFSTLAIEAVFLNRPIITINLGTDEFIDYTKEGVGYRVFKREEFLSRLMEVLENSKFKKNFDKNRKKFIGRYNYRMDGKALKRVLSLIDNI